MLNVKWGLSVSGSKKKWREARECNENEFLIVSWLFSIAWNIYLESVYGVPSPFNRRAELTPSHKLIDFN